MTSGRLLSRIDRAAGGLAADLTLYALSAGFALLTATTSSLVPHRAWGAIASWAYALGFVLAAAQLALRRRPRSAPAAARLSDTAARAALTWTVWAGAALLPLVIEAVQRARGRTDRAQEEVLVVERMGERLLHDGTPYLSRDAIAALPADERLMAYSPYQPGMSVFGLPRAIAGDLWWTDARVWFAVVTAAALIAALRILHRPNGPAPRGQISPEGVRALQAVTVLPVCALTLATGGDDLPVLALCLLALAFAATDRYGPAGVAVGAAAAGKLFALPVVAVLGVLALAPLAARRRLAGGLPLTRDRRLRGGPSLPSGHRLLPGDRLDAGWWFLPGAVGLPVLVLVPPFLVDPDAFVENVLRFPLGHGLVTSPAQSPFPGYLIAQHLPGGRIIAVALLAAIAAVITVRILVRPPATASASATIIGIGLLGAILLMPTTRFGYLLYPIAFLVWAPALSPEGQPVHSIHTAPTRAPG